MLRRLREDVFSAVPETRLLQNRTGLWSVPSLAFTSCRERKLNTKAVLLWQEFKNMLISLNMDNVLESLGGDQELLREVLGILLDELPKHMASLRQAIASGNAEAIEHLAHSIKGELGYLSLSEVSRNASDLEASGREANIAVSASLYGRLEAGVSEVLPQCAEWLATYANATHS
jgi:HPt (histidine-containing phosphotransfer) domain-containing protein